MKCCAVCDAWELTSPPPKVPNIQLFIAEAVEKREVYEAQRRAYHAVHKNVSFDNDHGTRMVK